MKTVRPDCSLMFLPSLCCASLILALLCLGPAALGANISLLADDALNTTSFTGATNWSNGLVPANTNDYFNAARALRTPTNANGVFVFAGNSLTITGVGNQAAATSEALMFKGSGASGLITVSNLTINGGELRNASGSADAFNLAGNSLTVGSAGMVVHMQGPIFVNSPVAGSGEIKVLSGAGTLHFASAANAFTGDITLVTASQSRFTLDAGANLLFVIGVSNVNNSISGSGVAVFNGVFQFDLSGAGTSLGDQWSIATVPGQTFGGSFSVAGFTNIATKWEINTNGAFYSFDTASGLLRVVSGFSTNTNAGPVILTNSYVALLRDSVVATNACLMPSGSTYGRAINGISFQENNILLTFDGYQYTAWYDTVGTTQLIWLARRAVTNTGVGAWEKFQTDAQFLNGDETAWDAHNVVSLGICPADGTLHMAWDHHNNTLRYRRSVLGLCTTNKAAWGAGMLNAEQNWLVAAGQTELDVTYPQFTMTPAGRLIFNRRMGVSGNGDQYFQIYNPATGAWSPKVQFINRAGTYVGPDAFGTTRTCTERCAYINGLDFDPTGTMHVTWTWRESASQYGNRDICYAYSPDQGTNWFNNVGTLIANTSLGQTITQGSPGITVASLNMRQLLINQQAQCVDNEGRVHVLMLHRRQEAGYEPSVFSAQFSTKFTAYYHYFRDPVSGVWSQTRIAPDDYPVGSRPKIGYDAQGNVYAVFLSYPAGTDVVPGYTSGKLVIAAATKAAQYTNWTVMQAFTNSFNGEPLLDQARLLADNILSVYIQENSATTTVVGTPLHAFDFAVRVKTPNPLGLEFAGQDSLVTLIAPTGHTYQLQSSLSFSPAAWTNAGPVAPGVNGLIALPDPNGRQAARKFYRVIQDP